MAELIQADKAIELYLAQKSYIELLVEEIDDLVGLTYVHRWKSTRHELGVQMRERIKKAEENIPELPLIIKHAGAI